MLNSDYSSKYSVLYVDDELQSLKYFKRAFQEDFNVLTASNPSEALEILDANSDAIAILISDQRMPLQSGVQLLDCARKTYPAIVRILTTAYANLEEAINAVNQGEIFRYVTKPWDLDMLYRDLSQAMAIFLERSYERNLLEEKREAILRVASSIAHEMRTPLLSIRSGAKGIQKYLPILLDGYHVAKERGLPVTPIREARLDMLPEVLNNIEEITLQAGLVIDILLANSGANTIETSNFTQLDMAKCIQSALDRYPLSDEQQRQIQFDPASSFTFLGSESLMVFVLFNLLQNAFYAIQAKGGGEIEIRMESDSARKKLFFRDTGMGISAINMPKIFDDFYTSKASGTGVGLPFCRRVIESFGADISCSSEEQMFTEFVINFSPMQGHHNN